MFIQNQKQLQKLSEEGLSDFFNVILHPNKKAIRLIRMALSYFKVVIKILSYPLQEFLI